MSEINVVHPWYIVGYILESIILLYSSCQKDYERVTKMTKLKSITTRKWVMITLMVVSASGIIFGTGATKAEAYPIGGSNWNWNRTSDYNTWPYQPSRDAQSTTDTTEGTSRSDSSTAAQTISIGQRFLGTKYEFGADTNQTKTFDCSSFVKYVFKQVGVDLPRTSYTQAKEGKAVSRSELQTGDLVFFATGRRGSGISHVAIYAGNGRILHTFGSPGVTFSDLSDWDSSYVTARRVL